MHNCYWYIWLWPTKNSFKSLPNGHCDQYLQLFPHLTSQPRNWIDDGLVSWRVLLAWLNCHTRSLYLFGWWPRYGLCSCVVAVLCTGRGKDKAINPFRDSEKLLLIPRCLRKCPAMSDHLYTFTLLWTIRYINKEEAEEEVEKEEEGEQRHRKEAWDWDKGSRSSSRGGRLAGNGIYVRMVGYTGDDNNGGYNGYWIWSTMEKPYSGGRRINTHAGGYCDRSSNK